MNKLFSLALATTILAAAPLMAMDEPEAEPTKGVKQRALPSHETFSSKDFQAELQRITDQVILVLSPYRTREQLTDTEALRRAQSLGKYGVLRKEFLYHMGTINKTDFCLESQEDAKILFKEASGNPEQKCILKELKSVNKGAKFAPTPAEKDLYCTIQENNTFLVLRYLVSDNNYLNFVAIPSDTDSDDKMVDEIKNEPVEQVKQHKPPLDTTLSSEAFKARLQNRIDGIIEFASEDYSIWHLTPEMASKSAQHIEDGSTFDIRYRVGQSEEMVFFCEGRQDAERLLSIAYGNPKKKCTLGELQYVKKGAKFSPQPNPYWSYWVEKDGKRIEEHVKEEDRYCTQKENNDYPVLRYSVSENPDQYLNFVVMPFTGSTHIKQYEAIAYRGQGQYTTMETSRQDNFKSLENTHNVDLIINGDHIPAGEWINIAGVQGYFEFTPKTSDHNDRYRLSF